jgi:transposase
MAIYIGLDVHSKMTTYVIMDETGKVRGKGEIPTDAESIQDLFTVCEIPEETKVGLESGTQSTWMSRLLRGLNMEPIVINAHEVHAKARSKKQKSDTRDAHEICDGIRRGIYTSIVYVPEPKIEALRQILSRRSHFVKLRTAEINASKFLLRSKGRNGAGIHLTTKKGWTAALALPVAKGIEKHIKRHQEAWELAERMVEELDEELKEAMKFVKEDAELLQTMPGVGPITAGGFIAALGDPKRFPTSGHVASYLGLVPSMYDSGGRERHGHITKTGPAYLRGLLCEGAHGAARLGHPLNPQWRRQCVRGGYRKAVMAVAHRTARILYQMWKKGERFDGSKVGTEKKTGTRSLISRAA